MSIDNSTIAKAFLRYKELAIRECFDPVNLESRPTPKQGEVLSDINTVQHRYVTSGNQCLPGDTLVMTPKGPVRLDAIKVGDIVYDELGQEQSVVKTWCNGPKEIGDLTTRNKTLASCTAEHRWWTAIYKPKSSMEVEVKKINAADLNTDTKVLRKSVKAPLGPVSEPHAYAIGALLGDGCSRQPYRNIHISSGSADVPVKVAAILGSSGPRKLHDSNYTWSLETSNCNYYEAWCKGRYTHEKTVDLEVVKSWDRVSLLSFVAGLLDTDGSVYPAKDHLTLSLSMQALPVVEAFEYACLALWQIQLNRTLDNRAKYKNGPVHVAYTRNVHEVKEILAELGPYLVKDSRRWKDEYETLGGSRSFSDRVKLTWGSNRRIVETYDITVSGKNNVYLLANGLITSNSGKSQLAARECAWVFTETHPFWKRPDHWGKEPLQLLVVGRTSKQVEEVLWRKVAAFLDTEELRIQRIGGVIQKVVHKKTGNTIIFASHHNEREAREKLQAFTANWCWVDELPGSVKLVEELHRRVQAKRGYFLATFTPKSPNPEIKKLIDNSKEPYAKKYQFAMFDNPIYSEEDKLRILDSLKTYPDSYRRTVLYGDWAVAELNVYQFERDKMIEDPQYYSNGWRHVVAVDPALQSKFGFTLWAENPNTGIWYLIRADYISGVYSPEEIFDECEGRLRGYNLVRRISDPHESWFINTASSKGISYIFPFNKTQRKGELIKNLQASLSDGKIKIASWCTDFIEEIESCQWSETTADKIVNSRSFHLLDSAQYFVDCRPKDYIAPPPPKPWHQELREGNQQRKKAEALAKKLRVSTRGSRWLHSSSSGSRRLR